MTPVRSVAQSPPAVVPEPTPKVVPALAVRDEADRAGATEAVVIIFEPHSVVRVAEAGEEVLPAFPGPDLLMPEWVSDSFLREMWTASRRGTFAQSTASTAKEAVLKAYPFVRQLPLSKKGNNKTFHKRIGCTQGYKNLLTRIRRIAKPVHDSHEKKKAEKKTRLKRKREAIQKEAAIEAKRAKRAGQVLGTYDDAIGRAAMAASEVGKRYGVCTMYRN